MTDPELVRFLQWALPRMGLRWKGFRKVRRQVRKRLARRLAALGLPDLDAYQQQLQHDPGEWAALERMCGITISRFFRDHRVWEDLAREVLPALLPDGRPLRAWSAGCASGEEPYTLVLVWHLWLQTPGPLQVMATDVDPVVLGRAQVGCYPEGALREVPAPIRDRAFTPLDGDLCLRPAFKDVRWLQQDLREEAPPGPFDLVLCRNLAFTYFDEAGQQQAAARIAQVLRPGGALVVATHEQPPSGTGFGPWPRIRHVYRRSARG